MVALQKSCCRPTRPRSHCAVNYHPAQCYLTERYLLVLKTFLYKLCISAVGGADMCVWVGGCYVFTNGVAGIFAAMTTNHMTRCIILPRTVCSEAWCEHSLCCSVPLKVLSLSSFSVPSHTFFCLFCIILHCFTDRNLSFCRKVLISFTQYQIFTAGSYSVPLQYSLYRPAGWAAGVMGLALGHHSSIDKKVASPAFSLVPPRFIPAGPGLEPLPEANSISNSHSEMGLKMNASVALEPL